MVIHKMKYYTSILNDLKDYLYKHKLLSLSEPKAGCRMMYDPYVLIVIYICRKNMEEHLQKC